MSDSSAEHVKNGAIVSPVLSLNEGRGVDRDGFLGELQFAEWRSLPTCLLHPEREEAMSPPGELGP